MKCKAQQNVVTGFTLILEKLDNLGKWEGIFQLGNFEQTKKVRENHTKTGKVREFCQSRKVGTM